jgi:hypothetical protein
MTEIGANLTGDGANFGTGDGANFYEKRSKNDCEWSKND